MDALILEPTKTKRAGVEPSAPRKAKQAKCRPKRTKEHVILLALRHGSLNRFEAERIGDHCLHTTVATLTGKHGLRFEREWESVPTRFGVNVRVKRYWLADASRELADRILRILAASSEGSDDD